MILAYNLKLYTESDKLEYQHLDITEILSELRKCVKCRKIICETYCAPGPPPLPEERKQIESLVSQLAAASKDQRKTITTYQKANKQLSADNEKKEMEMRKLQEEVNRIKQVHKKEIAELRAGVGKVKEACKAKDNDGQPELQSKLFFEKMLKETEKANISLKCEKNEMENTFRIKIKGLETELSDLKQTLVKRDFQIEQLNKQRDELLIEDRMLREKLETLHRQNIENSESIRRVYQERDTLRQQIDDWVKQKHTTVHVQMYAAVNRELCEKMMNELEGMLSLQFELNNSLIQVEKYKQPPEDSPVPLLVLCVNASRLGTDVNQALHNVSRSRTVAVIVLHHKEMHALPRQPSEKLLIGSDYKHIGLIVDIAYLTTKGIYPCDMNEKSLDRLVDFIKSNFKA